MEMLEKMEAVIRSMQDKVHRAQGVSAYQETGSGAASSGLFIFKCLYC